MSDCLDRRFDDMLYAYEVGMLTSEERRELELHLLECEHCMNNVLQFQQAARLMKYDPDVRETVRSAVRSRSTQDTTALADRPRPLRRRRLWFSLVPTSAVAAAILFLLLVKDWQLEFRPSQEAVAVENRVAVMYFENLADPEDAGRLGEIVSNLLITDLSESRYLQIVSSQRLYDILKLLGHEGARVVDRDIASQVADEASATWIIMGSILQAEPHYVITGQLTDVATGNAVASQRIDGKPGDDIFSLVDRLTVRIKEDLSLPSSARQEPDRPVADVTTHSPEAYRYYLEGIEQYHKYYTAEAAACFERAVRIDSTFAMAYYYLARTRDTDYITSAVKYADRAGQKDRYYIKSLEAIVSDDVTGAIEVLRKAVEQYPDDKEALYLIATYTYGLGDYDEAVRYLTQIIEMDPLFKVAYNMLAYSYNGLGDVRKALEAINTYISLAPEEPNPYDSRGDIYAANGQLHPAIESYRKALAIKPDFHNSRVKLGFLYVLTGEYALAEATLQELVSTAGKNWRSTGRLYLAYVPLYQGKLEVAVDVLQAGIRANAADSGGEVHGSHHLLLATIFSEEKNLEQALREFDLSTQVNLASDRTDSLYGQDLRIQMLAENTRIARAERDAEILITRLRKAGRPLSNYYYAVGTIELSKGNWEKAAAALQQALEDSVGCAFPARVMLGRSHLELGRYERAVDDLETALTRSPAERLFWGLQAVRTYYYLGLAYEQMGRTEDAAEQYRVFLDLWAEAETGAAELDDARARLARLTNRP
ncbi:MAG TPA: FlgO family outer membrane protein [Acidobacteriota bacterium]|nr:FlgO family outer membrane protein [Acidobacteriota bacterium]